MSFSLLQTLVGSHFLSESIIGNVTQKPQSEDCRALEGMTASTLQFMDVFMQPPVSEDQSRNLFAKGIAFWVGCQSYLNKVHLISYYDQKDPYFTREVLAYLSQQLPAEEYGNLKSHSIHLHVEAGQGSSSELKKLLQHPLFKGALLFARGQKGLNRNLHVEILGQRYVVQEIYAFCVRRDCQVWLTDAKPTSQNLEASPVADDSWQIEAASQKISWEGGSVRLTDVSSQDLAPLIWYFNEQKRLGASNFTSPQLDRLIRKLEDWPVDVHIPFSWLIDMN